LCPSLSYKYVCAASLIAYLQVCDAVRKPIDSAKVKDLAAVQRLALDPDDDRCFVIDEWRIRAIDAEEASKWVAGIEAWRSWFRSRPERSGDIV